MFVGWIPLFTDMYDLLVELEHRNTSSSYKGTVGIRSGRDSSEILRRRKGRHLNKLIIMSELHSVNARY